MSGEAKRYWMVSDGCDSPWFEDEGQVLNYLTSPGCDFDAVRVLETVVPEWQYAAAEDHLLAVARDMRAKRAARTTRVRRVVEEIAKRRHPTVGDVESLPPTVQHDLYVEARAVLAVADATRPDPATSGDGRNDG